MQTMSSETICRMQPRRVIAARAARGFSMAEMMVALTVSLFVIGALVTVVMGSSATSKTNERASELQINGRYALESIKIDLMHAGFLGISSLFFPDQGLSAESPQITVANACDAAMTGRLSQRVWGANDANPYAATCIPASNYSTGDVLVIRGLNPVPVTAPFSATRVYYHSSYEGGQPFKGPTPPDFTAGSKQPPYLDYLIEETVYYISPYTNSANESPRVPALYRLRLGNGPAMVPELVATGVENLQIRYGQFLTNKTMRYLSADQMAGSADWDLVRSVQIWLLMRSSTAEAGYQNNNTYPMGAQDIAVNDNFRRLLLSTAVELRN